MILCSVQEIGKQMSKIPQTPSDTSERQNPTGEPQAQKPVHNPGPSLTCPNCREGKLHYDGCLNLACDQCGYVLNGGGFT